MPQFQEAPVPQHSSTLMPSPEPSRTQDGDRNCLSPSDSSRAFSALRAPAGLEPSGACHPLHPRCGLGRRSRSHPLPPHLGGLRNFLPRQGMSPVCTVQCGTAGDTQLWEPELWPEQLMN